MKGGWGREQCSEQKEQHVCVWRLWWKGVWLGGQADRLHVTWWWRPATTISSEEEESLYVRGVQMRVESGPGSPGRGRS